MDQPVPRFAHVEVAASIGPVSFGQRRLRIDAILEALGDAGKAAGVHRLRRLEQVAFLLPQRRRANALRRPRDQGDVLESHAASCECLLGLRQLLQLARDVDTFGGGAA